MPDWFVLLTPILLVPIALHLFFVGCFADVDFAFASIRVNCYLLNVRLGHNFEVRVYDSGVLIRRHESGVVKVVEGGASASRVDFSFIHKLAPGRATLTCRLVDLTSGELLIDEGDPCEGDFEIAEPYDFVFNAGISADGLQPNTAFEPCVVVARGA